MADNDFSNELSNEPPEVPIEEPGKTPPQGQPERVRVHSLARALGTTSKRVLDALVQFDGRARSAQSVVDTVEAERVRAALAERWPAR